MAQLPYQEEQERLQAVLDDLEKYADMLGYNALIAEAIARLYGVVIVVKWNYKWLAEQDEKNLEAKRTIASVEGAH